MHYRLKPAVNEVEVKKLRCALPEQSQRHKKQLRNLGEEINARKRQEL